MQNILPYHTLRKLWVPFSPQISDFITIFKSPDGAVDDVDTDFFVLIGNFNVLKSGKSSQKCHSASGDHTAFNSGAGSIKCILKKWSNPFDNHVRWFSIKFVAYDRTGEAHYKATQFGVDYYRRSSRAFSSIFRESGLIGVHRAPFPPCSTNIFFEIFRSTSFWNFQTNFSGNNGPVVRPYSGLPL